MQLATSYNIPKVQAAFAASGKSYSQLSEATGIAVSTVSRLLQTGNGYSRNLLAIAKALKLQASDIVLLGSATQQAPSIPTPFMSAQAQTKMGSKRAKQLNRLVDGILSKPAARAEKPPEKKAQAGKEKRKADAKPKAAARKTAALPARPKTTKTKARPKATKGKTRAATAKTGRGAASNRHKPKKR